MAFGKPKKAQLKPIEDGPLEYRGAHGGDPDATLVDAAGHEMKLTGGEQLCRCGGSRVKPFCDSSHLANGYSSRRVRHVIPSNRTDYPGDVITIHDVRGVCAHVAACTNELPTVFREGVRPWVDVSGAPVEEIARVIRDCPSGALTYSVNGEYFGDWGGEPEIRTDPDGPFEVSGGIELVDTEFATTVPHTQYTLCRCGGSKNNPFCDGTHWDNGFTDTEDFEGGASAVLKPGEVSSGEHGGPA